MSIILKENEWSEKMIRDRNIGTKPSETLRRVARYYLDSGYSKSDTRKKLELFFIQCNPELPLPKWSSLLDRAVTSAVKTPAADIDGIVITKPEIEKIKSLSGKQLQRLAFTILCLAKYHYAYNPESNFWVNTQNKDIMSMANVNTSIRRQGLMFKTLRDAGMIQFSKKVDNTNVRVCFAEEGDEEIVITDFRNLGYQYLKLIGDDYFECENCGITTKIKNPGVGRSQKYCPSCAVEIAIQQKVNFAMRRNMVVS